jgi:hypothetical protein
MELHHHSIFVYVGRGTPECSRASGYARHEPLAQVCPRNIVLLQKQGGDVHMRAARAGIRSGLGNSATFDGKEDSE